MLDGTLPSGECSHSYLLHQALVIEWRLASALTDSRRPAQHERCAKLGKYLNLAFLLF